MPFEYLVLAFFVMGTIYYTLAAIDVWRWWNGPDENGNPK